jgi:hypothetical protein
MLLISYLTSQHLSIDVDRALNASFNNVDWLYGKYNISTQVAKTAVYTTQGVLADAFFVSSIFLLLLSFMCSDLGGMEGLAVLHCLEQTLAYNCPTRYHALRNNKYAIMNISLPKFYLSQLSVAASGVCWEMLKFIPGSVEFLSDLAAWGTSAYSMTLATNIVCTGM